MSIDERLKAIAERTRPITAFCAIRRLSQQEQQDFYFKRLKFWYTGLPDDQKEKWLDEQEKTK